MLGDVSSPSSHIAAFVSLSAVLSQMACGGLSEADAGNDAGESGGSSSSSGGSVGAGGGSSSSGGASSNGGALASGGATGSGGAPETGGTGGTVIDCSYPDPTSCGEGGCDLGDSGFAEGASGGCVYVVEEGPTGDCLNQDTMGECSRECFCRYDHWLCWKNQCEPVACGGQLGDTCTEDQYCDYRAGQACGTNGETSVCKERPQNCPPLDAPVCSCHGVTYSNECIAFGSGSGILHDGACE